MLNNQFVKIMQNLPDWVTAICALVAIPISIWAVIVAKNTEAVVHKITQVQGPAGIVQTGGKGSFSIGDLRVGQVAQQLAAKEYGLENAKTAFSGLSNRQLAEKGLALVSELRTFASDQDAQRTANSPFTAEFISASAEEQHQLWTAQSLASEKQWAQAKDTYNRRFKIDTIILRDELRQRLPRASYAQNGAYEEAWTRSDITRVADDLERLAKLVIH